MTKKALHLAAGLLLSISAFAQEKDTRPFHIGLIYPISSNGINAEDYVNYCSINAIAGLSGGERGFCASGLGNVIMGCAGGFTAAGFVNIIKDESKGTQVAGFMNSIGSGAQGLQAAGFMNLTSSGRGTQLAGFANITPGNMEGFQAAGFMNLSCNTGVQIAGFMNIAGNVSGLQTAGFTNIAGDVNTQISGFLNVAGKVKGTQIGFINVAEENDNPIGVVNIIKNGEKNIGITVDESLTTLATFRSGGKNLYGIIGAGYNLRHNDILWALETGLGVHAPISKSFRLNFELVASSLTNFYEDTYLKASVRALPSLMLTDRWEIFAGPTFTFTEYSVYDDGLEANYVWSNTHWDSFFGLHFGAIGGVQFHL
ncbi:MAG: hypothetical protein K0R82_2238 [Flavipsychrobacter sp.]|jgi:hypothetical protein|nr:hypothetical protein [Flavipsychrobacter sp.]